MDQTTYRFSIKQEVLLEKSAETLGEVAAYYRDHRGENVEPWKSIYEHLSTTHDFAKHPRSGKVFAAIHAALACMNYTRTGLQKLVVG